jgi:CDP-diacylglycerol--serine O-phosphatidyltransferase
MSSIREAARGEFSASLFWLGVSAIFDGLDGHVARRLNTVTRFGGELDSLCDLVDFGAVRVLIGYHQFRSVMHAAPKRASSRQEACAQSSAT